MKRKDIDRMIRENVHSVLRILMKYYSINTLVLIMEDMRDGND